MKEYTITLDDDAIFLYKKVAQMSGIPVERLLSDILAVFHDMMVRQTVGSALASFADE